MQDTTVNKGMNIGRIVQIIGAVLDVKFAEGAMPNLYNALEITMGDQLIVAEVAQHLGGGVVRCISMESTDGLTRGMPCVDTGQPIAVPVGPATLGRMFNVIGKAIDGKPDPEVEEKWPIHRPAPTFAEQASATEMFETG
ncbi:MAG: F0F1 ATP synthase subunit beta, partial [Defluviitaleaceae bacterium]|nr:F0F1 ATP synthase subunit beta [Defluviitaleaceae bacterium]